MKRALIVAGLFAAATPVAVTAQQPPARPNVAALSLADAISVTILDIGAPKTTGGPPPGPCATPIRV
jgi:hypothetical protein